MNAKKNISPAFLEERRQKWFFKLFVWNKLKNPNRLCVNFFALRNRKETSVWKKIKHVFIWKFRKISRKFRSKTTVKTKKDKQRKRLRWADLYRSCVQSTVTRGNNVRKHACLPLYAGGCNPTYSTHTWPQQPKP